MNKDRFINIILLIGVILGATLASISLVKETNFRSEGDWVAKVEEVEISRAKFSLLIQGLASDKRTPITQEDKAYVLERMIEEELLIHRARDLGMLSTNTMVRGTVVQQMINLIISDNNMKTVKESALKKFYEENKGFFTNADRLRVRQLYFTHSDVNKALEKANNAFEALLANENFAEVAKSASDSALQLPDTLMTLTKVREYLGPSLMKLAKKLQPGQFTKPIRVTKGYKIIYLVNREDSSTPEFQVIRDQVKSEFMKRRDDLSLRKYLENLKDWYDITRTSEY